MKKIFKEVREFVLLFLIAAVVAAVLIGGLYAIGYFGSQIWFDGGPVSQSPILSRVFKPEANVNEVVGILTLVGGIIALGIGLPVSEAIKKRRRRDKRWD